MATPTLTPSPPCPLHLPPPSSPNLKHTIAILDEYDKSFRPIAPHTHCDSNLRLRASLNLPNPATYLHAVENRRICSPHLGTCLYIHPLFFAILSPPTPQISQRQDEKKPSPHPRYFPLSVPSPLLYPVRNYETPSFAETPTVPWLVLCRATVSPKPSG